MGKRVYVRSGGAWVDVSAPSGDVFGPASSTDNSLPRFDATTGKAIQASKVVVNDSDVMFNPAAMAQSPKSVSAVSGTYTIDLSTSNYFTGITAPSATAPTVVNVSTAEFGSATTGTLTLPSGLQQGDIVVVLVGSDGQAPATSSTGWTSMAVASANTTFVRLLYKTMGSTPDSTIAFTGISTASCASATAIRNGTLRTTSQAFTETATNVQAQSPAIVTAYGNELVLSIAGMDDFSTSGTCTAPTGYSNLAFTKSSTTGFATMISSKVVATPGTETPGAYTTTTSDTTATITLAFTPTTGLTTIAFSNAPSQSISGYSTANAETFVIETTSGYGILSWPGSITWAGSVTPPADSGCLITITTTNGGSTYRGTYVDGF